MPSSGRQLDMPSSALEVRTRTLAGPALRDVSVACRLVAAPLLGLFLSRVCLLGLLAVCSPLCAPSPVPVVLVVLVVPVGLCRQAIFENIASQNRKQTESEPKAI